MNTLLRIRTILLRPRGRRQRRSGMAILVVVTAIMILTIVVTEITYAARVRVLVAAHQRDRAQAYWIARSGVNIYRLLLTANKELEGNSTLSGMASAFGVNLGDALWQMVPTINTGLMRMLFASGGDVDDIDEAQLADFRSSGKVSDEIADASRESTGLFDDKNFLDFDGDFSAEITDEESKLNLALVGNSTTAVQESAIGQQMYGLMSGEDHDQWFRQRNIDRWEIIGNIKDWIDSDNYRSGGLGGYEDNLYNSLDSPYLTKNAPFDTYQEIRLVEGWQDDVFERFGENLTIHGIGKVNINTAPDEVLTALIKAYLTPSPRDAEAERILEQIREYMLLMSFKDGKDFTAYLQNQGYTVDSNLEKQLTNSSKTFRIVSTGLVGTSTVNITTVVDYQSGSEGRVTYWRVD